MWGILRRIIGARAHSQSAGSSPEVMRMFPEADSKSADDSNTKQDRLTTAYRARAERQNNPVLSGIIDTLANDTIGTGPHLQLSGMPAKTAQKIERRWRQWSRDVDFPHLLRIARASKAVDGEVFFRLHVNPNAKNENRLTPMLFETECVQARSGQSFLVHRTGEPEEVDGITYDQYGNAVSYTFLEKHPGASGVAHGDHIVYPADVVLHYASLTRPGQHRGYSELSPSLFSFNDLRRYSDAVIKAAENAAKMSMIMKTNIPAEFFEQLHFDVEGNYHRTIETQRPIPISNGRLDGVMLPDGYDYAQMDAKQPTSTYPEFRRSKINEAARCFKMPLNIAMGDSSSYNYASGRLDHQVYYRSIEIEREHIVAKVVSPVFEAWTRLDGILHAEDYSRQGTAEWTWDGFESADPVKEAQADRLELENGTTSRAMLIAKRGLDPETVMAQNLAERQNFGTMTQPAQQAKQEDKQ